LPITPMTFPFTHHTMPLTVSTPSFVNWFSQPYRRLPGFGSPQRGDALVFNFPEGDTVVANFQNQSYYQLVRDVGIHRIADGSRKNGFRLVGDVKFDEVAPKCSWISPVPGGVGPMTITSLLLNTLKAAQGTA